MSMDVNPDGPGSAGSIRISLTDIMEAYNYLTSDTAEARISAAERNTEATYYLLRLYEKTLATWLLTGGIDVNYDAWGMILR